MLNVGRTGTARPIPPENNSTGRGGFQARSGPSPKFAAKLGQHAQIVPVGAVGGLPLLAVAVGLREDTVVLGTTVDLVLSDCSLIKKESIQSNRNYSAKERNCIGCVISMEGRRGRLPWGGIGVRDGLPRR